MKFGTDKIGHGYLPTYLAIAAELGPTAKVCELGVLEGQSLDMWQALFPHGLIVGVDGDPRSRWPEGTRRILSAQDADNLPERVAMFAPHYDLIIDDASHDGTATRRSWELLWPLITPGGYYIIEDWYVAYPGPQYRGDDTMLRTAQSFLMLFSDPDGEIESVTYRYGMIIIKRSQK